MSIPEKYPMAPTKAIDLSHHLSELSKARIVSPLKGLQKFLSRPGTISLAGGMPDPAYFPFNTVSADPLVPNAFPSSPSDSTIFSWFWNIFGSPTNKTGRFTIPKYGAHQGDVELATALQYSPATGIKPLQDFVRDFTGKVFNPAYSDWSTLVHAGNTDGFHRAIVTLCDPGEYILAEEWTYPSTMVDCQSMGVFPTPVKVDGEGLSAVDLEYVLSTWDETARKAKRPHVLYTVPTGQNPTGATMSVERKKTVYEICVKYDVIILEDDPYYFLQEGPYSPKELRSKAKTTPQQPTKGEDDVTQFLMRLQPSFVRYDYEGRVIRLDSFSKTIAPGSRLGWFTCNPLFAERLERQGETTTGSPCGFTQALLAQLLANHWSFADFIRWLRGLQTQYTIRRDFFIDCIFEEFDMRPASDPKLLTALGATVPVFTAYKKMTAEETKLEMREKTHNQKTPLFSFVPPSAGMFVWLKFHIQDRIVIDPNAPEDETIDMKVWTDIAEHGLLLSPGTIFDLQNYGNPSSSKQTTPGRHELAYRVSFSMGTDETLRAGIKILADVLKKYADY